METTFDYLRTHASELGQPHSRNLSASSGHEGLRSATYCDSATKGAPRSGTRNHRHGEVPAQSQVSADRRRMRGRQDLHGTGRDPCAG